MSVKKSINPDDREKQLINLAINLAEKQLLDGTASSQVVTHYLKLGSTKDRIEQEILKEKKTLIKAQTDALQSQKRVEELYAEALNAMKLYSGNNKTEEEDEEDE